MISIILAGGAGSRLWPLSRKFFPKFLLKIGNKKYSLFQQTFLRVKKFTPLEKIFVVVNKEYKFLIKEAIQDLNIKYPFTNIISEPEVKNTLPAVSLGCYYIRRNKCLKEDEVVGIFPSDHIIRPLDKFSRYVKKAKKLAQQNNIVIFGIKPTRIETDYGYIEVKEKIINDDEDNVYKVEKFIEKPNFDLAKNLIEAGNVYWNGGIFFFSLKTFFEELKLYQRSLYEIFENLDFEKTETFYNKINPVSIDKGIIEKTNKLVMLALNDVFWDDVGSWLALERIYKKDKNNNIFISKKNVDFESKNSIVFGDKRLIVSVGLDNLLVVDTEDALLIINKNYISKLKEIVEKIKNDTTKYHKTVQRPWGFYTILLQKESYKLKLINILPQKKISLQKHLKRSEMWFVVSGVAEITYKDKVITLKSGETFKVEKGVPHRLKNPSKTKILEIVELSQGRYLLEDDIIKLEDDVIF